MESWHSIWHSDALKRVSLLRHPLMRSDWVLKNIRQIVERDEPSHWAPYDAWLQANGKREHRWWKRAINTFIHSELLFLNLPALFLTPRLKRRIDWADDHDPAERLASPFDLKLTILSG